MKKPEKSKGVWYLALVAFFITIFVIGYWNSDWESLQDQTVYYDSIVSRKPKKKERIKNK